MGEPDAGNAHSRDREREETLARIALSLVQSDQLPALALAWVDAGLASPALFELAGMSGDEASELWPLFERCRKELALPRPDEATAVLVLARAACRRFLAGDIDAGVLCAEVAELHLRLPEDCPIELHPFIYVDSDWNEQPEMHAQWTADLRGIAAELVAGA